MRLIDADALIEKCGDWYVEEGTESGFIGTLENLLATQPTIQPEPHWIPVTERLPYAEYGESDNVLATCGYRDVEDGSIRWIKTLYFNGGNWCYPTGETYLEKVYAWMHLPEPYKGVTE